MEIEMDKETCFPTKSVLDIAKNLYMDEETADVHFIFDIDGQEQRIPAHKNILARGSSVFRSMFYGTLKEDNDIQIVDASPKGFTDFLAIFYLHETRITSDNLSEFLYLANKYDMPEGMKICELFILQNIEFCELCVYLPLANKLNLNKLKQYCEFRIRSSAVKVFETDSFVNCPNDVLKLILQIHDLNCIEVDIFNACKIWAENACKRIGSDHTNQRNLRNELGECFYLIPFTIMKTETFSNIVFENRELFTLDEIVDIMALITTGTTTEHTTKFIKSEFVNVPFDWSEASLLVCARDNTEEGTGIYCEEYTVFTSSHKLLFGGFKFFDVKRINVSESTVETPLSATITITKDSGLTYELQERIPIIIHKGCMWPTCISFNKPIVITPHLKYVILVDFSTNDLTTDCFVKGWECSGSEFGSTTVLHQGISFVFHPHTNSEYSDVYSLISQFLFNRL